MGALAGDRAAAGFLALAALWGTAFVATKAALATFPPVLLAALRFDVAAAVLFAATLLTGRWAVPTARGDLAPVLAGGLFSIGLHHALLFTGQQFVTSAVAATLLGLIPVLTPAATRVLRPAYGLDAAGVVGVLVGFAGLVVMADPDPRTLGVDRGTLFVAASAVAWVAGAVTTREDDASLHPVALQAWTCLAGAVVLHLAALPLGQGLADVDVSLAGVAWLAYLAVVPGALGFLLYFRLLDRLGPIRMGLLEYAIPPFAALFGFLVLDERLAANTVVGFAFVLAAFVLVQREPLRGALRRRFG